MKVSIESTSACRRVLHVEVPADTVNEEYKRVMKGYLSSARVDGFRKGKAPLAVVEQRYREDITEATRDNLVPRCYHEALEKESLAPVNVIGVSDVQLEHASALTFDVTIDVAPEFKVGAYRGVELDRDVQAVEEEDIQRSVDALLEQRATYDDVDDRGVEMGDLVKLKFSGTVDGAPIGDLDDVPAVLAEADEFWYNTAPEGEYLPGFSTAVEGAAIDADVSATVSFPDGFQVAALDGKTAEYAVKVQAIRKKVFPELNEEIWSAFDVDSEVALRDKIRTDLGASVEQKATQGLRDQVLEKLLEQVSIDLPESEVEQESKRTVERMVYDNLMRGISRDQLEKDQVELYKAATELSRNRLRVQYLLQQIGELEDVQVDDGEVDAYLVKAAESQQQPVEKLKAEIQKNGNMDAVLADVRAEKVLDFLVENAKIKDR